MKVSVIIPCYNAGAYIEPAISSVQSQTYSDWEIIIVNDGSTESQTKVVLDKLRRKAIAKCTIIDQENRGLAGARNAGIAQAKGKYIVCLDSDDIIEPTYLEETVGTLETETDKRVAIATTWLQEFGIRQNIWKPADFNIASLLVTNRLHVASMYRRELWTEIGGYKKGLGGYEDWDFWLTAAELGYTWVTIPKPLFRYRIRQDSMLYDARKRHAELYAVLYDRHKDFFAEHGREYALIVEQQLAELHATIAEKDVIILDKVTKLDEQTQAMSGLQKQVLKLTEELGNLKNSRLISKAIRLRALAGRTRHRAERYAERAQAAAHKVRVVGAPYVPRPVRKAAKLGYRMLRLRTLHPYPTTLLVDNVLWSRDTPPVSVIIPYYNLAATIDETIASLQAQTFTAFEVILVNDGSTEPESVAKLETLRSDGLRLRLINQKNQGVAAARNTGIAQARGKYIICLDSDDILEPTYIEKAVLELETNPDIAVVSCHQQMFGVINELYVKRSYDPLALFEDNMVITAAMFRKKAWEATTGYRSNIGYEDWEFWVSLAEKGYWGKLIPEPLFRYRTASLSRYIEDKSQHWQNLTAIRALHPHFVKNVRALMARRALRRTRTTIETAFLNLRRSYGYQSAENDRPNVLIAVPWMTFGGAETLIYNFCKEVKDDFNISFVTGLESMHEWEYKFRDISPRIYHLANLFDDEKLYIEFISNYVTTRHIQILHIIHTSFMFGMLEELKKRHKDLKIIVTVFNSRAEHFALSVTHNQQIDVFSTDNQSVARQYYEQLPDGKPVVCIPNGIDCYNKFNQLKFNRAEERSSLQVAQDELAVFFIGRLSEEKNPDVFIKAAGRILDGHPTPKIKFFVIGDGAMRGAVEKAVAATRNDDIQYLGYKAEVASYLSAADVFVLPSAIEGFPLSILEAMAMRVVVIASDVGAVAEIIETGKDGFVIAPSSVEEIIKYVKLLNQDRQLLKGMADIARSKVERLYSNIILGRNYKKLYRSQTK